MKPPGIARALDLVDELEAGAVLARLDLDRAVGELAAAAGLLLVAGVGLGRLADRLLVGHARRVQLDLGAEAALHPLDDHLDVDLGEAGDDLLAGLRVAVDVEGRVLLGQPPHRRRRLLLVPLRLRLVGERHHRRRQVERREGDLGLLLAEDVAGPGLLQLRDRADVPGAQLGRPASAPCPAAGRAGRSAPSAGGSTLTTCESERERAAVDAEEVDPAGVGVGEGLEDVGDQRRRPRRARSRSPRRRRRAPRPRRASPARAGPRPARSSSRSVPRLRGRDAAGDGEDPARR